MKIKTVFISALVLTVLLWACWSFAYQCGYSRGARDEFACWEQVPMKLDAPASGKTVSPSVVRIRGHANHDPSRIIVGQRNTWTLPGGKEISPFIVRIPETSINNIPSRALP